jgi:hypothetical protein
LKKQKGGGKVESNLLHDCRRDTEEWYHKSLHNVFSWKSYLELEDSNLPLLMQHLKFMAAISDITLK